MRASAWSKTCWRRDARGPGVRGTGAGGGGDGEAGFWFGCLVVVVFWLVLLVLVSLLALLSAIVAWGAGGLLRERN